MDAQAKEVIDKVQNLVKTKFKGDYLAAFTTYDLDHNGHLGPKDINKILEDCGIGNWLTRGSWVSGVISALDLDHDGVISVPELVAAMQQT